MNNAPLLTARNLSRFYGGRRAIEDISFTINRGEIVSFLGPNGAGKSTLMQILCGVLAASSGQASIAGHDIVEQALQAKQHLGYLPEQPPLYLDCTVDEYLVYCARLRGINSARVADAVAASKHKCGLGDMGKRLINNLSKGYRQRIGIAQAIIHAPDLIILDEPSSGVDPNQMIEIRELIREMGKQHSIILSTHMLAEAQAVSERILIIHAGRVVLDQGLATLDESLEQTYLNLTRDVRQETV
jgi:ABC-2 type transport system ATP-binding protein